MREMLMTVSVLDWGESGAKETPAIVVNWDEGEDGDIETLVDSSLFLLAYGTSREDIENTKRCRNPTKPPRRYGGQRNQYFRGGHPTKTRGRFGKRPMTSTFRRRATNRQYSFTT
jgi:hypothetical protein